MKKIFLALTLSLAAVTAASAYDNHQLINITTGIPTSIAAGAQSNVNARVDVRATEYAAFELRAKATAAGTGAITANLFYSLDGVNTVAGTGFTVGIAKNGTNFVTALTNVNVGAYPYVIVSSITNESTGVATNITLKASIKH